jgi:Domain of unknown function (DUF4276)
MNIQPIVEGFGEVEAVPVLVRRLRDAAQAFVLDVNQPIRKRRSDLADETQLRKAVRLAQKQEGCGAILIIFDSDKDCPAELGPTVQAWAQDEAGNLPCVVVLAHHEYEAWFLAAIESLRGTRGVRADASSHEEPERPRGAKEQLEQRLVDGRSYSAAADQTAMTAKFDMARAYRRCRSFRRMVRAFGLLAAEVGVPLDPWPPESWQEDT